MKCPMNLATFVLVVLGLLAPACEAQVHHRLTDACPSELKRILTASDGKDSVALRQFLTMRRRFVQHYNKTERARAAGIRRA